MDKLSIFAYIMDRVIHGLGKMLHIIRNEVRQVSVLGVIPDHLNWIQVGCIAGQPFHFKPVHAGFAQEANSFAVCTEAVHNQDELSAQMTMDEVEKSYDLHEGDVVIVYLKVQAKPTVEGSQRYRRDNRQAVVPIPTVLDWRLTLRCPRAAHRWLQHEATFVYENDTPPLLTGFFLTRGQSSLRQRPIASSSRSRARRSGFWQLQPISRRMYHT